jgi:hypothetical protein
MHEDPAEGRGAERRVEDDRRHTISLASEVKPMRADVDEQPGCSGMRQISCKQG